MSADARSRAGKTLNVPVDATAEAATCAFLAGLKATDFVPPGHCVAALNTLVGVGIPIEAGSSPTLREEVEEFARRYWTLTPADRLAAWLALSTRCPDDATAERLLTLQAGLELPGTPFSHSAFEQIASIARLLYVLPARERAIRRNVWLLANAARHKELIASAAAIQKNHPQFAVLDPGLFERLSPRFNAALFADAAKASPLPKEMYGTPKPIVYPPPKRREPPPSSHTKLRASGVYAAVVCLGLLFLFRVIIGAVGSHSHPTPGPSKSLIYPQTAPEAPRMILPPAGNTSESTFFFNQSQVDACMQHERDRNKPAPSCYLDWVLAGKPPAYELRAKPPTK